MTRAPFFIMVVLAATSSVSMPGNARAQTFPPPFERPHDMPGPMVASPPATGITMGGWNIEFEKTTLSEIVAKVGVGAVAHRGDAGGNTYWVCYTAQAPTPQRIWFTAGELDGPTHLMSGIQAVALAAGTGASASCPTLPARSLPLSLDRGIWLGSSSARVTEAIGRPSVVTIDAMAFAYTGRVSPAHGSEKMSLDRTSFLHLTMRDGRVRGIVAEQTTTN